MRWSEFIGGDAVILPSFKWQQWFNYSDITLESHMGMSLDPAIIEELEKKFSDFRYTNSENRMEAEFDTFGATRRILRLFTKTIEDLSLLVRDYMIPNPVACWRMAVV
jgi:transaldolase